VSRNLSRRTMLKAAGAAALSPAASSSAAIPGPRSEGKDTPKICLGLGDGGGLGPGGVSNREKPRGLAGSAAADAP
jgi:hypothetical protein